MEKVAAVKCPTYEPEKVYEAIKEALRRLEFVVPEDKTVLLKPNILSQNKPAQHTITHYCVVAGLCRILRERNCRILIGESIAFYESGLTRKPFETSNIKSVADKYGAQLIAFEEEKLVKIKPAAVRFGELYIPEVLLKADVIINVCKLKTHGTMRLSGAIKNMFGCLPGGYKQKVHALVNNEFELSEVFAAIHKLVQPTLSIMDAVVSLDGGPSAIGKPVETATILASTNAAALDATACSMIGYEVNNIPTLLCAEKMGLIDNYNDIEVLGIIEPVKFKKLVNADISRRFDQDSIFIKHTYVDPLINRSKCDNCLKCIGECPVNAIKIRDGKVVVENNLCINCYHCLFVCPQAAIGIVSSPMNKLIRAIRYIIGI